VQFRFQIEFGDVFSFGSDNFGELGDGNPLISSSVSVAVSTSGVLNGINITKISAGYSHALVLGESCEFIQVLDSCSLYLHYFFFLFLF